MNSFNNRYHAVKVIPTLQAAETEDGENLFLWTEIPNAIPRGAGGVSVLKSIQVLDLDNNLSASADIDLYFAQTKDADATVTGALGATSTIVNMTDAEVQTLKPLCYLLYDFSTQTNWNFTNGQSLSTASAPSKALNSYMYSFPTQDQIDAGTARPGSIYFMGVATATKTHTASGLEFTFIFEY